MQTNVRAYIRIDAGRLYTHRKNIPHFPSQLMERETRFFFSGCIILIPARLEKLQAGKTTAIRHTAVREAYVSQHHVVYSTGNSCEKHERKARIENTCKLVYARKLVKARESSRAADDLQFLGGIGMP